MSDKKLAGGRIWLLVALTVPLLLLGILLPVLFPRPSPVTLAALHRVKIGMTPADVKTLLGGPPGDYRTVPVEEYTGSGGGFTWEVWYGDEVEAWICFESGLVHGWMEHPKEAPRIGTVELVLWRLGRVKDHWLPWLGLP